MFRIGACVAAVALAGAAAWAGLALAAQEPKAGAKGADLTALREAVAAAARRGENVDEIRKAVEALDKALPAAKAGAVPPELQSLRDAVDSAARKGENVEGIEKELAAVEAAVAGRSLAKPKPRPEPPPAVRPNPLPAAPALPPNPFGGGAMPFPDFKNLPDLGGAGVDAEALKKALDMREKALELMLKNPRDPEAQKLLTESMQMMLKAARPALGGGAMPFPGLDLPGGGLGLPFPDLNPRAPERARLGVRFERVNPVTADQLGLDPDVGIAVVAVLPGSAAEQAGLKVHDIIVEFAGKPAAANADDFIRQVGAAKAGDKLNLVVFRKGKRVEVKGVVLPDPDRPERPNGRVPLDLTPAVPAPAPKKDADAPENVRADAPAAAPDLGALRDAVADAARKGENVGGVRGALAALEAALAKAAAKAGEAPPELAALRAAVESAARKGEDVAAVSAELGKVEKALTGRAYERPKTDEPKPEPPGFAPRLKLGPGAPGAGGRMAVGGGITSFTTVSVTNGAFTVRARLNDVSYTLTGTTGTGGASRIVIKDGDKTIDVEELKKVPEEYRPTVERLLKQVNR